jgi:hypothetical protein
MHKPRASFAARERISTFKLMEKKEDLDFWIKIEKRESLYGGRFESDNLFPP